MAKKKAKRTPSKAHKAPQKKGGSLASAIKTELSRPVIPGQIHFGSGDLEANVGRPTKELMVANSADRPIQVGSHCHFFEVNRALDFDRQAAYGMRLNIPAGTAVRFEPGDTKDVEVVALGGTRTVYGINGLVNGPLAGH